MLTLLYFILLINLLILEKKDAILLIATSILFPFLWNATTRFALDDSFPGYPGFSLVSCTYCFLILMILFILKKRFKDPDYKLILFPFFLFMSLLLVFLPFTYLGLVGIPLMPIGLIIGKWVARKWSEHMFEKYKSE